MGRMSELHAAAPDALGLAVAVLKQEASAAERQAQALAGTLYRSTGDYYQRRAERHRDAIETLTLLAEVLAMPVVPVTYFGDVEEGLTREPM